MPNGKYPPALACVCMIRSSGETLEQKDPFEFSAVTTIVTIRFTMMLGWSLRGFLLEISASKDFLKLPS